jgi:adhesin transport system outer membrane protein
VKQSFFSIVIIFLSSFLYADQLFLNKAAKEILKTNPQILEKLNDYKSSLRGYEKAKLGYYPTLDLSGNIGTETTSRSSSDDITLNVSESSLTLNQNLFNGFGTKHEIELKKAKLKSSAYSYIEKANDVIFKFVKSYIDLLRSKELLEIEKKNVSIHEEIYKDTKKQYKSGIGRLSDLKEVFSKLSLAYSNYLSEENNYKDKAVSFHKFYGRYIDAQQLQKPAIEWKIPQTFKETLLKAMQNNPSIIVQNYEFQAAKAYFRSTQKSFYPKIDLELKAKSSKNIGGSESDVDTRSALLKFSYNLFNGGRDAKEVQIQKSLVLKQNEQKSQIKREIIENANLSWNSYEILKKQIDFLRKYKKSSEAKIESYKNEFDLGRRSLLDLLSAQDDYIDAKRKEINAEYDLMYAKFRILDSLGELPNSLGINVKDEIKTINNEKGNGFLNKELFSLDIATDIDIDKIIDSKDICSNSLLNSDTDKYGCAGYSKVEKISFLDLNQSLDEQKDDMEFDFGNTDDQEKTDEDNLSEDLSNVDEVFGSKENKENKDLDNSSEKQLQNKEQFQVNSKKIENKAEAFDKLLKELDIEWEETPTVTKDTKADISDSYVKKSMNTEISEVSSEKLMFELIRNSIIRDAKTKEKLSVWSKNLKILAHEIDNEWYKIDSLIRQDKIIEVSEEDYVIHKNDLKAIESIENKTTDETEDKNNKKEIKKVLKNLSIKPYEEKKQNRQISPQGEYLLIRDSIIRDQNKNRVGVWGKGAKISALKVEDEWYRIDSIIKKDRVMGMSEKNYLIHESNLMMAP